MFADLRFVCWYSGQHAGSPANRPNGINHRKFHMHHDRAHTHHLPCRFALQWYDYFDKVNESSFHTVDFYSCAMRPYERHGSPPQLACRLAQEMFLGIAELLGAFVNVS